MRLSAQNIGMEISVNEDIARDLVDKLHEVFAAAGEDMPKHLGDAMCDLQIQLDAIDNPEPVVEPVEPIKAFIRIKEGFGIGLWKGEESIASHFKSIGDAQKWALENGYIAQEMEIEGIMIDDWTSKEADGNDGGFGWTQMCSEHAKGISDRYQDDHGSGICAVVGCGKESDHYINDLEEIPYNKN